MTTDQQERHGAAGADATVLEPLAVPFVVAVDTREQLGYQFEGLQADARQQRRPLLITTERRTLAQGDYSIVGHEDQVAVERKALPDLFGTLGQGRGRFERELTRLDDMVRMVAGGCAWVMVEADWHTILTAPPEHSSLNPKTIHRSVIAWQQRYPRVHWWFVGNRRLAEITTFRLLERWWTERERAGLVVPAGPAGPAGHTTPHGHTPPPPAPQPPRKKPPRSRTPAIEPPEWSVYQDLIDTALADLDDLPEAAEDFAISVEEKLRSIAEWIEEHEDITQGQQTAVDNMIEGIGRWQRHD
jgi:DNA excision repair protein ERCC-4